MKRKYGTRGAAAAAGMALAAALTLSAGSGFPAPKDDPVKVECRITPLRLSRGEEGKVVLKIYVRDGTVVNAQPPFIVEFGPSEELVFPKNFFTAADLGVEVVEEGGRERLNLKNPVQIPFTVGLKAKRNIHVLEGRIKYFVTSPKEGWCLKSSTKFSATFSTRLTVIQKGG
jgi:hypothetical protein